MGYKFNVNVKKRKGKPPPKTQENIFRADLTKNQQT